MAASAGPDAAAGVVISGEETLDSMLAASQSAAGRARLAEAGAVPSIIALFRSPFPPQLLLPSLRVLRNLCAGDRLNQDAFLSVDGPSAVTAALFSSPPPPAVARAGLQLLGNAALAGELHGAAVWRCLFPEGFVSLSRCRDVGVCDTLCMVLDTCCSGEEGRTRLGKLCDTSIGMPILVEIITTISQVGYKEEWSEWLLFKVCSEENKVADLFQALGTPVNLENKSECDMDSKHVAVLSSLSKCLSQRPKEVQVSNTFAIYMLKILEKALCLVDFTSRGRSPVPTGSPPADILGLSLVILRDICAWEHPESSSAAGSESPVESLLKAGLLDILLASLRQLEPPAIIRKSMQRQQEGPSLQEHTKVCPYIGYRTDLVSAISNCLYLRKQVQDEVRRKNAILLLLQQCVVDEENPFLREWGIFAVRNLLEGNAENQTEVAQLELQHPVVTPEMAELGLKVEIDKEKRHAKLVNIS